MQSCSETVYAPAVPMCLPRRVLLLSFAVAFGAAPQVASTAQEPPAEEASAPSDGGATVDTHLYALERRLAEVGEPGGAIGALGDDLLVATRWGRLLLAAPDGRVTGLEAGVPMNRLAYQSDPHFSDFRHSQFRVADILLEALAPGRWRLFATHHYFVADAQSATGVDACIRFRLSATTILRTATGYALSGAWRTVFDAQPCLPTAGFERGRQAGGRMAADGAAHLLLVLGDHGMDGRPGRGLRGYGGPAYMASQLPESHFGKLLRVAIDTGEAEVLASGLRVPQGLARDAEGKLWETEHGPQGGDELNLLTAGANYGWPHVTYGVGYGGNLNVGDAAEVGRHVGFAPPAFSWVPSIGVSAIVVNDKAAFPLWRDDLLVASLEGTAGLGHSIYRIRRNGQQVRYVERIPLDAPIRDLAQTSDGRLALLHDDGRIATLRRSDAPCTAGDAAAVHAIHCPAAPHHAGSSSTSGSAANETAGDASTR